MNQFFPWTNEETIGEFISSITESKSKPQAISVKQAKAKGILCSFDMSMQTWHLRAGMFPPEAHINTVWGCHSLKPCSLVY